MIERPTVLKPVYETLLRELIDAIDCDQEGIPRVSNAMQALKYFLTYLCNKGIPPSQITIKDLQGFAFEKYQDGCTRQTLAKYIANIRQHYLDLVDDDEGRFSGRNIPGGWIDQWVSDGIMRGSRPSKRPEIEIAYTGRIESLLEIHKNFHLRR